MHKTNKSILSRRKFLKISACSLAFSLTPNILNANEREKISWSGIALGAQSNMTLFHKNKLYAKDTLDICINEIKRLENIFSLFIPNSSICLLNKNGNLKNPPKELVEVLKFAEDISIKTNGAFDVTVQPLWVAHAKYSNNKNKLKKAIKEAKNLISYKNIQIKEDKISFKKPNVQITLNGIAQGYITDKITSILRQKGFTNVLVDLGELNSIGGYNEQRDWNIATPYLVNTPYLKLNNQAMASSGGYGTMFSKRYHHLFDTKTRTSANYIKSVTVKANNATLADALATAICVMPKKENEKLKNTYPEIEIYTS
ncbi:FAD:protein FMN transferase [Arcobacter peruensis]|uniref:FAD:protein FMN transferase n=1 Tax=Arcobacter peruensis TaxID=2320140 RepID=UPI000F08017F|nr:FAD:protein FMN transferase [Arcobacter peruensis]